jgi:hypothetical protein
MLHVLAAAAPNKVTRSVGATVLAQMTVPDVSWLGSHVRLANAPAVLDAPPSEQAA